MADKTSYSEIVLQKIGDLDQKFKSKSFKEPLDFLFKSLKEGGVWHLFATGHSTMAIQEAFHRAGGLVPVNPWLEEYVMPQSGPTRNSAFEKLSGLAQIIYDYYQPQKGELLTIISNSGINIAAIEMGQIAKKNGIKTLAITNLEHSKETKSRHPSGVKLYEVCDYVINTGGVKGDAAVSIEGLDVSVGPLSTLLNAYIINSIVISICEEFCLHGLAAPVYLSANLPGGPERNRKLESQYLARIPRLR